MKKICCNDCNFINADGEIYCVLDMHVIYDVYKKFECEILNKYEKFRGD